MGFISLTLASGIEKTGKPFGSSPNRNARKVLVDIFIARTARFPFLRRPRLANLIEYTYKSKRRRRRRRQTS